MSALEESRGREHSTVHVRSSIADRDVELYQAISDALSLPGLVISDDQRAHLASQVIGVMDEHGVRAR